MFSGQDAPRVVIVGGGICGLTCAIALAKRGIEADVYEAAEKFGEIGAGVGLGYNAIQIMKEMGVFEDVLRRANESERAENPTFVFKSGLEGHDTIFDYPSGPTNGALGLPRPAFLDALVKHLSPDRAHFNKRCMSVVASKTHPTSSVVHFADGTTTEADIVLLANGYKCSARITVTGPHPTNHVSFSNTICYRGLVPVDVARAAGVNLPGDISDISQTLYTGKGKHVIIYPINGGAVINVVAFVMDCSIHIGEANLPAGAQSVVPATMEEMLGHYEGWGSDVINLLKCIKQPSKWYINVVHPPLKSYVKGRVVLLGDAAHAMLPHLGAGAGQGIEDAYLLAQLLSHPETTIDNIEIVLRAYDAVRRPHTQRVWEGSVRAGNTYGGYGPHGDTPEGIRQDLEGQWDFVWHRKPEENLVEAVELLKKWGIYWATPRSSL